MRMQIRAKGGWEIQHALEMLPEAVTGKLLREAVMEGAEIIRAEAETEAEKHRVTGTLAGDIHAELSPKSTDTKAIALIGAGKKGWYGRLVETGHALVRGKQVIGQVPPHPWLRPAADRSKKKAIGTVGEALRRRLERIWRRR